jgi:hypothetical protein
MMQIWSIQVVVCHQLLFEFRSSHSFSCEVVLLFSDFVFGIVGHGRRRSLFASGFFARF